ncbi:urea carboxylase-associated family protein [Brenneria izadpanahii]|uniref:Urea carboxylase-associated family protein n=1 Tax=Brenneria izadpanahii TaxID=2722756 RepID=A0ABX7UYH4_9GAMM|nr:urea carboxylase-associated family protein [Brenneria izadpanahii]QTF08599.1 urea carboxylase-associated family protein [Brenneria izadpanahii]
MTNTAWIRERFVIPPYSAHAVEVLAGEELCIIDVEGQQVSDFICFNRDDLAEFVSPVHMRSSLSSIRLKIGDALYSNRRDKLMTLVEDTVGKHDFFFPACDYYRYKVDFNVEDHPNCHDNLVNALAQRGVRMNEIPDPINWFMNNAMDDNGDYAIKAPLSRPGDFVRLKALKNCLVACTTCSQDYVPVNGMKVTPIELQVISY